MLKEPILRHPAKQQQAVLLRLYPNRQISSYPELESFRRQLEHTKTSFKHKPYTSQKRKVMHYRAIFFAFGFLFLLLGMIVHYKTSILASSLLFGNIATLKFVMSAICLLLAGSAFVFSILMRTDKEVANRLIAHAKRKLKRAYERKWIELGVKPFFLFSKERRPVLTLKQHYRDARVKIHDHREEVFSLLQQVSNSMEIDPKTRENLYNQAMCELNEKLALTIQSFQTRAV